MKTNRPIVIIESPYAGNIDMNVRYARACVRDSILRGEAPFASHLLYTQPGILRDEDKDERALGIETGFAFRRLCTVVAFYTDLGISAGMKQALERCAVDKIPKVTRRLSKELLDSVTTPRWDELDAHRAAGGLKL